LTLRLPFDMSLYRGSGRAVALAAVGGIAQSLVLIPSIWLVRHAFDVLIPAGDLAGLALIGLALIGLYALSGVLMLWSRWLALGTTRRIAGNLREDLVSKIQAMPRQSLVRDQASRTQSLLVHDTGRVYEMAGAMISSLFPNVVFAIALGLALVYLNALLSIVVLAMVPLLTISLRLLTGAVRRRIHDYRLAMQEYHSGTLFMLQHLDLTRSQSAEEFEFERQSRNIHQLGHATARMQLWQSAHNVAQETVTSGSWALVLIIGGAGVTVGLMTLGDVLAFSAAAMMLKRAVNSIAQSVPAIVQGRDALAALRELLDAPEESGYQGTHKVDLRGNVEVDGVAFAYEGEPVLEDVNLSLAPGRLVLLAGRSGAGKTTLLHLLLGFYRPRRGHIRAEGVEYASLDIRQLRRGIGFVPQDPVIFSGSVVENITYGDPAPDMERLRAASSAACLDDFIDELADGYDALVGDEGQMLSGGQRQRIGIARALYREPKLLLLDEPTNQLDDALASRLLANLRALPWQPALLVVSHDLDRAAEQADAVYEMRSGRLVDVSQSRVASGAVA
jgi:ABC-type multidrug transport system fused ATPase/permease subunit